MDPKTLEIPAVRIDSEFDPDIMAMFQDDVKKVGIEQALLVGKSDGHLWVIDGRHRLEQALLNGIPTVPCIVREMDLKTIQMRNLVSNRLRGKTKLSEEIKVVGDLYTTHGVKIEEIVESTGMARERLETMILITQAHPAILEALDEDRINFCHATEIIRLKNQEKQFVMLGLTVQYHPKCQALKQWVDETIKELEVRAGQPAAAGSPAAPKSPTSPCGCCGQEFDMRELSNPFMCRGCFAGAITARQDRLRKEVLAVPNTTPVSGSPADESTSTGVSL